MTDYKALADRIVGHEVGRKEIIAGIGTDDGHWYIIPNHDGPEEFLVSAGHFVRDPRVAMAMMEKLSGEQLNRFAQQMIVTTGRDSPYPNQWTLSNKIQDPLAINIACDEALSND